MKRLLFGIVLLAAAAWLARADDRRTASWDGVSPRTEFDFGVTPAEVLDARTFLHPRPAFNDGSPSTGARSGIRREAPKFVPAED